MPSSSVCRLEPLFDLLGERWTLSILHKLSAGPLRTQELLRAFNGLSTKTLSERLRRLERSEIIVRKSHPISPPRVEYSLTNKGKELLPILAAVSEVAYRWSPEPKHNQTGEVSSCGSCQRPLAEAGLNAPVDSDESGQAERPSGCVTPTRRKRIDTTLL